MSISTEHIELVDKSFDSKKSNSYKLYIELSKDGLKLAVLDLASKTFVAFEVFKFVELVNEYAILEALKDAIKKSKFFDLTYKKTNVCFVNDRATLIPKAIYKSDQLSAYHEFNFTRRDEDQYHSDDLISLNAHNVYSIPDYLTAPFLALENVSFSHASSPFIEATLLAAKKEKALSAIWVNVMSNCFQLSIIKGQELVFFNTFNYSSSEDFIYFLLFALDQLDINNEEANLNIVGEIDQTSVIYPLLNKYVKTINFKNPEGELKLSYIFENIPQHYHFSLFNQYLCE